MPTENMSSKQTSSSILEQARNSLSKSNQTTRVKDSSNSKMKRRCSRRLQLNDFLATLEPRCRPS